MTDPPSDEDLTRVAPRFWSDDAMPLDAIVGSFKGVRNEAPVAQDPEVLRVAVFVDGTRTPTRWVWQTTCACSLTRSFAIQLPLSERSAVAPMADADPDRRVESPFMG